ncbi:MAG: LysE family translocator [Bacteroidetes bacterium]|nr:LysE family translocator [Bacteroidota bacterium]
MVSLFVGLIVGMIISIPLGPINVAVISKGFKQGFKSAFAVGLGASAMDFLYCGATMLGLSAIVHRIEVNAIFQIIGFLLLAYLGIRDVTTKVESFRYESIVPRAGRFHSAFLVGVFMYVSNPTLVAFWIMLSGIIQSSGMLATGMDGVALFALGVGSGTAFWYYLLLKAISWKKESFRAETLTVFSRISGYIMLSFGAYIGYELLVHFLQRGAL